MLNGVEVLLEYLNKYKVLAENTNNKALIKDINNLINVINDRRYIIKFDLFNELVKTFETSDIDNIMYDIVLNLNRYNVYLMNKKIKFAEPNIEKDIEFEEIKIDISDILNYLGVIEPIDKSLEYDLKKYIKDDKNKSKFMDFAKELKSSNEVERTLFDKIEDKDVLIAILIHSDINLVRGVISKFVDKNININKVVSNIPSIFIATKYSSKCKYDIEPNYGNFMGNIALLDSLNIEYKNILNFPVFFVNNVTINQKNIELLKDMNVNIKNILEHCGNILTLNSSVVFNNIYLLKFHNIELTDDNNNNGYTLLGMSDLDLKIDYLIESGMWKVSDGEKHDNIDLIRALIIKDDYLKWKNKYKYDIIENTLFEKCVLNEDAVKNVYEKYPILTELDNKYLVNGNYVIGLNIVSRHRLLKNLNNYKGKGNAIEDSLRYNSNVSNIDEVVHFFSSLKEMGDDDVKLSKRI